MSVAAGSDPEESEQMNQDKTLLWNKQNFWETKGGAAVTRCVIAIKESLGFNYTDMGCLFHLTAVGH